MSAELKLYIESLTKQAFEELDKRQAARDAERYPDRSVFKEPVVDEDPVSFIESIFDEELVFDVEPIFDEEPDDFATTGCAITVFNDPDITTAMADHNAIGSLCAASSTSSIDKEFLLNPITAAASYTALDAEPSNTNSSAATTCSTKCPSNVVDVMAPAAAYTVAEEPVVDLTYVAASPAINFGEPTRCSMFGLNVDSSSDDATTAFLPFGGTFKDVSAQVASWEVSFPKSLANVRLQTPMPTNCSKVCLDCNTEVMASASVLGITLNILSPNSTHYDQVFFWELPVKRVEWKPWPLPMFLETSYDGGIVHPKPWPFFIWSYGCTMNWDVSFVWKPPWPLHLWQKQNINGGWGAISALASQCTRAPINLHKLLPWLGCELTKELVQRKCGGNYRSLLERGELKIVIRSICSANWCFSWSPKPSWPPPAGQYYRMVQVNLTSMSSYAKQFCAVDKILSSVNVDMGFIILTFNYLRGISILWELSQCIALSLYWLLPVLLHNTRDGVVLWPMPWLSVCCYTAEMESKFLLLMGSAGSQMIANSFYSSQQMVLSSDTTIEALLAGHMKIFQLNSLFFAAYIIPKNGKRQWKYMKHSRKFAHTGIVQTAYAGYYCNLLFRGYRCLVMFSSILKFKMKSELKRLLQEQTGTKSSEHNGSVPIFARNIVNFSCDTNEVVYNHRNKWKISVRLKRTSQASILKSRKHDPLMMFSELEALHCDGNSELMLDNME